MFHMSLHKRHTHQCMHQWDHCNHQELVLALVWGWNISRHNSDSKLCKLHQARLGTTQCTHPVILLDIALVMALAVAQDLALVKEPEAMELEAMELEAMVWGANIAGSRFRCHSDRTCPGWGQPPSTVHRHLSSKTRMFLCKAHRLQCKHWSDHCSLQETGALVDWEVLAVLAQVAHICPCTNFGNLPDHPLMVTIHHREAQCLWRGN